MEVQGNRHIQNPLLITKNKTDSKVRKEAQGAIDFKQDSQLSTSEKNVLQKEFGMNPEQMKWWSEQSGGTDFLDKLIHAGDGLTDKKQIQAKRKEVAAEFFLKEKTEVPNKFVMDQLKIFGVSENDVKTRIDSNIAEQTAAKQAQEKLDAERPVTRMTTRSVQAGDAVQKDIRMEQLKGEDGKLKELRLYDKNATLEDEPTSILTPTENGLFVDAKSGKYFKLDPKAGLQEVEAPKPQVVEQPDPAEETPETPVKPAAMEGLKSRVELSDALTEKEVTEELHKKWREQGGGRLPALPGEVKQGDWSAMFGDNAKEMVCRDDSGKTRDIRGKFNALSDAFEKNPDAFTITDSSSGKPHAYLYRKIGVNDNGQPVYKCISMNGKEITTDNQYTLEWKDDVTPELVQHSAQDNYSTGLRVGTGKESASIDNDYAKEGKPVDGKAPLDSSDDHKRSIDAPDNSKAGTSGETYRIWINKQPTVSRPGSKAPSLEEIRESYISKCRNAGKVFTAEELKELNKMKDEHSIIEYLRSIGIEISYAF